MRPTLAKTVKPLVIPFVACFRLIGTLVKPAITSPFTPKGLGISRRESIAIKSSIAGSGLLITYLATLSLSSLPADISNPSWYLNTCGLAIANGPILVLAFFAVSIASYWDPDKKRGKQLGRKILRLSRLAALLFMLIVVLQPAASGLTHWQLHRETAFALRAAESRRSDLIENIEATNTRESLEKVLRSVGIQEKSSAGPLLLDEEKKIVISAINQELDSQKRRANAEIRGKLIRLYLRSLRLFICGLAMTAVCQGFAQWNDPHRLAD